MADFWKLVLNENMKIYSRLATWIMFAFLILVPVAVSQLFYWTMDQMDGAGREGANWQIMLLSSQVLFPLITIFTVVKAAESVAGEFTWGTIKLLLIRPWSRSQILLSKYISVLLFAVFFTVVAFAVTLLINMALFGYSGEALPDAPGSPWLYVLEYYGLRFVSLAVIVTFAFMLSSAFRSSGLAIGLSIFILLSGNVLNALFTLVDKPWVKYMLFPNLELTAYMNGGSGPFPNGETTLGFSLAVLAAYVILFNAISWIVFRKRDVAA